MVKPTVAPDSGGFNRLTEEDFDVLQDSLDYYLIKYIDTVQLIEASKAAAELMRRKGSMAIDDNDANNAAKRVMEDPTIKDKLRKMKEKICILKATLIKVKEDGKKSDLERAIDNITGG